MMFKTTVITLTGTLYDGEAWSVFLPGVTGEFEVLEMHKPIISLLKKGRIIIDWKKEIFISRGAVKMTGDELVAIVEE
ncbi:MAG: hypothetical protein Q7S07_02705 [Candidatus Omnitrophota bacterium]|nr:hypothetical protein [Candidatus Omnitrophota bacterium]